MVFQDPTDSLNPRHTAFDTIAEPLKRLARSPSAKSSAPGDGRRGKVGLPPELLPRYPHQLSGGRKRASASRARCRMSPALLVLDEPTAALGRLGAGDDTASCSPT
jgi:peptide/nickel transport system ATP-binding protein